MGWKRAGRLSLLALLGMLVGGVVHAAPQPLTLKVALYPYVPGQYSLFMLLAREFQKRNEGVTLELVEPPSEYYGGGLAAEKADVYEIDTILLSDMVDRIVPVTAPLEGFTREAVDAVTRNGVAYAVPHWLCGNFLFYRRGDKAVADAATWADLAVVFKDRPSLVFDFYGRLTLGEWYLTLLADRVGITAAQQAVLQSKTPDQDVVDDLRQILAACPTGFCRSPAYHAKTGFYARTFVRGAARAYMGYSESLHYGLQEIRDNCGVGTGCLSSDDIAVRRLPSLKGTAKTGIGWVDGLAISKDAAGAVKDAALKFVEFATSIDGYRAVLQGSDDAAARYLLPARIGAQPSPQAAPLYSDLLAAHAGRVTGTAKGLNDHLRDVAGNVNCALPVDRTDSDTLRVCVRP